MFEVAVEVEERSMLEPEVALVAEQKILLCLKWKYNKMMEFDLTFQVEQNPSLSLKWKSGIGSFKIILK